MPKARRLEHDPEKWEPAFGKDHAQTNNEQAAENVISSAC
jgi:hypothetical protein